MVGPSCEAGWRFEGAEPANIEGRFRLVTLGVYFPPNWLQLPGSGRLNHGRRRLSFLSVPVR